MLFRGQRPVVRGDPGEPSWGGTAGSLLRRLGRFLRDGLYPPHCEVCAHATRGGEYLCEDCLSGMQGLFNIAPGMCRCCSRLFWGEEPAPERCVYCERLRPAFQCAVAVCQMRGVVRELVHHFKYGRRLYLKHLFGQWLQAGMQDVRLRDPPVDALVGVPMHWWKQARRGYNQAQVLAAELSQGCGILLEPLLVRRRGTSSQTLLGRGARRANMRGVIGVRPGMRPKVAGRHFLLVDDVLTSGATLDACARALTCAGAASVRALVVARG